MFPLQAAAGRAWLTRPFPSGDWRRVLLVFIDDPLAWPQYRAFMRYRKRFLRAGIVFRAIAYDRVQRDTLPSDVAAVFVQSPYEPPAGQLENVLALLRRTYPGAPISYFDWFAPSDVRFAASVAPYVSAYVKKALLRDTEQYRVPTRGHTQLVDYYSERYGLPTIPPAWPVEPAIIERLIPGPSFYSSRALMPGFERIDASPAVERSIDLHARIATGGTPWYSAMRQEAYRAISTRLDDLNIVSHGRVTRSRYMAELAQSKLCFSPFGYGELCWRDFEAMATGAVLVKPDMSHVSTAPDAFRDGETYLAVRWDLSDLHDTIRTALAQPERLLRIAENARSVVRDYLAGPALEQLVDRLISAPPRSPSSP